MLEDMWDPSVIWWIGLEADREDVVLVVTSNVKMLSASLVMLQAESCELQFWNMLDLLQGEAMKLVAELWYLCDARVMSPPRGRFGSE